jgi:SAM-dependent methyltransferase
MDAVEAARAALRENPTWYHTIELAPGVVTPGHVDLRKVASRVLPDDLRGKRALDVGTFDGFWAFEMERRGAEVVALDVERLEDNEWPPISRERLARERERWQLELGRGFRLAKEALSSKAERVVCDVYDLAPEAVEGPVDLVFAGAILVHLRDPVRALERIHSVLAPGGELRSMEPIAAGLSLLLPRRPAARFRAVETDFNWWQANIAALRAWMTSAGFQNARRTAIVRPPSVRQMRQFYAVVTGER